MHFLALLWKDRSAIWQLAKNDCKARFAAAGLGVVWAFLQPLLTILVIWFVFQVGFKSTPVENVPFIVWYIPAFLSWNYFSESVSQSTNSLLEYSYLLKNLGLLTLSSFASRILSFLLVPLYTSIFRVRYYHKL